MTQRGQPQVTYEPADVFQGLLQASAVEPETHQDSRHSLSKEKFSSRTEHTPMRHGSRRGSRHYFNKVSTVLSTEASTWIPSII